MAGYGFSLIRISPNLRYCPYAEKHRPEETRVLAYFTLSMFHLDDNRN